MSFLVKKNTITLQVFPVAGMPDLIVRRIYNAARPTDWKKV
jgi:hypothetical protein